MTGQLPARHRIHRHFAEHEQNACDLPLDGENMDDVFRGAQRDRTMSILWEWRFSIAGHPINRSPMLSVREGRYNYS